MLDPDWPYKLGEPLFVQRHRYALGYQIPSDANPARDLVTPLHAWTSLGNGDWKYLSSASKLDRIIWDLVVVRWNFAEHCDAMTLLTEEVEFDALIFRDRENSRLIPKISYFPVHSGKPSGDLNYWEALGASAATRDELEAVFHELVVWNCYELTDGRVHGVKQGKLPDKSGNPCDYWYGVFARTNVVFRDAARKLFANVPVPAKPLFANIKEARAALAHDPTVDKTQIAALRSLYSHFRKETKSWVTAVGSPMLRNLESLSALLLDDSKRATLVTGLPGTGKEAYARALHFSNQLLGDDGESVLIVATALELAKSQDGPVEALRARVRLCRSQRTLTFFVDELNKCRQPDMLSELLRVVEDPNRELELKDDVIVRFVFAASEHLDELTKRPSPQDFWTRISHQLRVVHPLAYVSERDAFAFLRGYFLYEWWSLVSTSVHQLPPDKSANDPYRPAADFVAMMFGGEVGGNVKPSVLCDSILNELVGSLVPLVTRDSLSVRGVRSIVGQVFARVLSHARYVGQDERERDGGAGDTTDGRLKLAIAVNCAIQDVLAVLNAARGVPRSGGAATADG